MPKNNGVNYSMRVPAKSRRVVALHSLEASLASGSKNDKKGDKVPLTESNIKRIEKEIATLKKRV